jgi:hypothetical protein
MNQHARPEEVHEEAWELLPWLVNGSLAPDEQARVSRHVEECEECRREIDLQTGIQAALEGDARIEYAPQPSYQKLIGRIEELERAAPEGEAPRLPRVSRPAPGAGMPRWLTGVLATQGAFVLALALLVGWQSFERFLAPNYQTLTSAEPSTSLRGNLRVVLAPDVTVREFGALLGSMGARVVAGPTDAGAWTLAIPYAAESPKFEAALRQLRLDPRILLAEPIVAATAAR